MLGALTLIAVAQLPVVPGAHGFGIDTPAGRGGTVHIVSSLAASGAGTLAACLQVTGPRVCVFEVSGTITLTTPLEVRSGNLTIAGQTAPAPGILIRGAGLVILASDVLVQHLRFRVGDDLAGPPFNDRDALSIASWGPWVARNVVIDHCSFSWSTDEMISLWSDSAVDAGVSNVTLLDNIFAEPLHDSFHTSEEDGGGVLEPHGYGVLFGGEPNPNMNVSLQGNLLAFNLGRNPLSGATRLSMVNNVVYGVDDLGATQLLSYDGDPTFNSIVGNVYLRVASPSIRLTNLPMGTRVFLSDNHAPGPLADPWSEVTFFINGSRAMFEATSAPVWPSGLVALPASGTLSSVLSRAGARPLERDAVDTRIVNAVDAGTGSYVNCVASDGSMRCQRNGGGWPTPAQNTRALTLPADPNGDADGDGYTNLEEWLHGFAAMVEGTGPVVPVMDRFSNDQTHGSRFDWEELTPSRWALAQFNGDWRYAITTTSYNAPSSLGLGEYALSRHGTFDDFRLTFRFQTSEDLMLNSGADACLVFGYVDPSNYHYLMLSALSGNSQLFRMENDVRSLVADVGVALIPNTQWHDVTLERVGTSVTASLDGVVRLQTVVPVTSGRVGIGSFNDAVAFDDVVLARLMPDGGVADAGLTDSGVDAGASGADAGTAASDAGPQGGDAGALPTDAGMTSSDAGTEAGGVSGCGCATLDVTVLLGVLLMLRRRQKK